MRGIVVSPFVVVFSIFCLQAEALADFESKTIEHCEKEISCYLILEDCYELTDELKEECCRMEDCEGDASAEEHCTMLTNHNIESCNQTFHSCMPEDAPFVGPPTPGAPGLPIQYTCEMFFNSGVERERCEQEAYNNFRACIQASGSPGNQDNYLSCSRKKSDALADCASDADQRIENILEVIFPAPDDDTDAQSPAAEIS